MEEIDLKMLKPPLTLSQQEQLLQLVRQSEVEKKKRERLIRRLEHDNESIQAMYQSATRLRDHNAREKDNQMMYNRLLLDSFPNILFVLDPDLRYTIGTDALICKTFGFADAKELVALPIATIIRNNFDRQWAEHVEEGCRRTLNSGSAMQDTYHILLPTGRHLYIDEVFQPVRDARQEIQGIAFLFHDVTELVMMKEKAEEASRSKTSFLANMSHEMRTPLNAIIGMTAIAKATDLPEKKADCLEQIEAASIHLLGVINDVLDLSKIEADRFELCYGDCLFEQILRDAVGVVAFQAAEKKQAIYVLVDPAIPRAVTTDRQRLLQVITNLLSNAVKFTPDGGQIELKAHSNQREGAVHTIEIAVEDNGIGISPEQQSRLFQPFTQADNSVSRRFGGTGLGLAISMRIVEMLGGHMWVESTLGEGSRFAFALKCKEADAELFPEQADTARDRPGDGAAKPSFAGKRLLLVEDIEINREIVIALLAPTEIEIDCAENGLEACRMMARHPERYDAVLMDIQMPIMDGYNATRTIRQMAHPAARAVPIIAMTANVFREDIEKSLAVGMNGHIGKPLNIDEVIAAIGKYIQ